MTPIAQNRIELRPGIVEYLDVGVGTPILYFHGTGAGNEAALLLEQSLLAANCRLIVPNRPGYYRTTLGCPGSASFCAEVAAELLDYLGIGQAVLIGTSGGGMPAASFARCYPDRAAALILQCAQSHPWNEGKWLPNGVEPALICFRHHLFYPFLRWHNMRHAKRNHRHPILLLRSMSGSRFPEISDDLNALQQITQLAEMSLTCASTPAGIQNDWAIMVGNNGIMPDTIHCPTLIIHDRSDPLVPFLHAEWSQSCIARSRLLEIHAGGHLIWFGKDNSRIHDERISVIRSSLAT